MSKKEKVVVGQSGITAGQMKDFWRKTDEGTIDRDVFDYFLENVSEIRQNVFSDIEKILEKERKAHQDFFGEQFDLSGFEAILKKCGSQTIKNWLYLGLEPHFLPPTSMPREAGWRAWKVKPERLYYQGVAEGKILRRQPDGKLTSVKEVALEGITVLIDTRLKPNYRDGKQMFKDDNLLGPIIERLREEGKIKNYNPRSSRFCVSAQEWQDQIRPTLADFLNVETNQVRLETVIEANVIPQLYPHMPRHKDGETNTWIWYEEYFEIGGASCRLFGGGSGCGGLADVSFDSVSSHWGSRAVRPLVVLS